MARREYTQAALDAWLQYLDNDWQAQFLAPELKAGRRHYRHEAVGDIELGLDEAIIYSGGSRRGYYVVIDWDGREFSVRSSSKDRFSSHALAIAGLYEIEELTAEQASPLPLSSSEKPVERVQGSDALQQAPQPQSQRAREPRQLMLSLSVSDDGLEMVATWKADAKSSPTVSATHDEGELSIAEREQMIRMARLARRAGFQYVTKEEKYCLRGWRRAVQFASDELAHWERRFELQLKAGVNDLRKGMQEAEAQVQATQLEPGRLSLQWLVTLDGEALDEAESRHFAYRDGSAVFSAW